MKAIIASAQIIGGTAARVFGNWGVVLRLSAPMILPVVVAALWFWHQITTGGIQRFQPVEQGGEGAIPVLVLVCGLLAVFGFYWLAVGWHRFEVLGERPRGLMPRAPASFALGYFGRTLLVGLVTALLLMAVGLVGLFTADRVGKIYAFYYGELPYPVTIKNLILSSLLLSAAMAGALHVSLILPAGAVGRKIAMSDSSLALRRLPPWTPFVLMLMMHLIGIVVNSVLTEAAQGLSLLLLLPFLLMFWLVFGVALLTRVYMICFPEPEPAAETAPPAPLGPEAPGA